MAPGTSRPRGRSSTFPTIGFLLADIHTGASTSVWPGVAEEAARRGANLICFPGGRLGTGGFDAGKNLVFDLAGPDCLDGLLTWASSLGGFLSPEAVDGFHARYRGFPMVSLALAAAGSPCVTLDAHGGMRAVISHLIEVHGHTRVAFIRGPEVHASAQERYRAYEQTLAEHGLPLHQSLVTRPLAWDEGEKAVEILLEERQLVPGRDFQAVAAASDLLALWTLKGLQARGFRVPADVAVTGFNDTAESRLTSPPLTTAAMPFREGGTRAVDELMSLLKGGRVPRRISLATTLVVRQSCGCPSAALGLASSSPVTPHAPSAGGTCTLSELPARLADVAAECLKDMAAVAGLEEAEISAWLVPLWEAFSGSITGGSRPGFLATLDGVLDRAVRANIEITPWQAAISSLRRRVLALLSLAERSPMEDLFAQARVLIDEAVSRERTYREWSADRLSRTVREVGASILTAFDVERIADAMADGLPRLGIGSFYLALYEEPQKSRDLGRLVLARTEKGRFPLPAEGVRFPTALLIPREFLPKNRRYELVVTPLFFQERQLGYAVFEVGPRNGAVYEEIRAVVSNALKGALLLGQAREARRAAEKADLIKTRLLANVSHELRAPLNVILGRTRALMEEPGNPGAAADVDLIRVNAEHQLRVINDLLDLSRAEIDELDLNLSYLDPRPILEEVFNDFHGQQREAVEMHLEVPQRLPAIKADPVRIRQILLNLMANATRVTVRGSVTLGAKVCPPWMEIYVTDTGPGIPEEMRAQIFEPFFTAENADQPGGIGLGLSIARHLTMLHAGELTVDSRVGSGTSFRVHLPLPDLSDRAAVPDGDRKEPVLVLISCTGVIPAEIAEFSRRQGLKVQSLAADTDLQEALSGVRPAALAWDLATADPRQHLLLKRLRRHPALLEAPLVLYGLPASEAAPGGLTGFLPRPADRRTLLDLVESVCPSDAGGPVLVVDDDEEERAAEERLAAAALPGTRVFGVQDGIEALEAMKREVPCLVLLDLRMPRMDGMEVLDRMRGDPLLRRVPVIVLTNKLLGEADVRRLETHANVVAQSKGVWSDSEAAAALSRSLFGREPLPTYTAAFVKRAVSWLARNHEKSVTRWKLSQAVNASEDYLARVFHRELGISPWEYLSRYRVHRAKALLRGTERSIKDIASAVGFRDQAYFSRVFRKITGMTPQSYRQGPASMTEMPRQP